MAGMPYKEKQKKIEADRDYYKRNAEKVKKRERSQYKKNRKKIRARRKELSPIHLAKNAERERVRYAALRVEIIGAYGGKCSCCGELEKAFLEIDHSQNDGAAHRRQIGRGSKACYAWLKKRGFPHEGYQLLCANCNQGRKRNGGICPHKSNSILRANGKSNSGK
jgi:hypothetical protein